MKSASSSFELPMLRNLRTDTHTHTHTDTQYDYHTLPHTLHGEGNYDNSNGASNTLVMYTYSDTVL